MAQEKQRVISILLDNKHVVTAPLTAKRNEIQLLSKLQFIGTKFQHYQYPLSILLTGWFYEQYKDQKMIMLTGWDGFTSTQRLICTLLDNRHVVTAPVEYEYVGNQNQWSGRLNRALYWGWDLNAEYNAISS